MYRLNDFTAYFLKIALGVIIGLNGLFTQLASAESKAIDNAWQISPLVLNDLQAQSHNLYDWHGKVILLNFWATWCGPCRLEIPDLIRWQRDYAGNGLQVVSVGLDERRKLKNFARTLGINYPVLQADPEQQYRLLRQWGDPLGVLPFSVVIGQDGHLIFMQQGVFRQEAFDRFVKPLLD